jgi:hypothetical protein
VEYKRSSQGEWFTGHIPDELPPPPLAGAPSGGLGGHYGGGALPPPPLPVGGSLTGLPTIQL